MTEMVEQPSYLKLLWRMYKMRTEHGSGFKVMAECADGEYRLIWSRKRIPMRTTCWSCGHTLSKPDKALRALCGKCANVPGAL